MNYYKRNLIGMLVTEAILIGIAKSYEAIRDIEPENFIQQWSYWIPLIFGIFVVFYAFQIKCQNKTCNRRQVFRQWPLSPELHWPKDKCYFCGTPLHSKHNDPEHQNNSN